MVYPLHNCNFFIALQSKVSKKIGRGAAVCFSASLAVQRFKTHTRAAPGDKCIEEKWEDIAQVRLRCAASHFERLFIDYSSRSDLLEERCANDN